MPFISGIPLLRNRPVLRGERWVYSAGFNVALPSGDRHRVDEEVPDLRRLLGAGACVAILAHQGTHRDGSAIALGPVAGYLAQQGIGQVTYFPQCAGAAASRRARQIRPGEAVLFGNTRMLAGEELNDPDLATAFAELGEQVAVGGFSKAHRRHASNCGIVRHRPGFLADSVLTQLTKLTKWRVEASPTVAVLGGVKKEKLQMVAAVADRCELIVPGGAVLNALLAAQGVPIGDSTLGDAPEWALATAASLLSRNTFGRIWLPQWVVAASTVDRHAEPVVLAVGSAVPRNYAIVDFEIDAATLARLEDVQARSGKVIVAGTPALHIQGYQRATSALLSALGKRPENAILLGGDTNTELPWDGPRSTGGGSALRFLSSGDLPILAALRVER